MFADRLAELVETRVHRPHAVAEAAARRTRPAGITGTSGRVMMVAADHPDSTRPVVLLPTSAGRTRWAYEPSSHRTEEAIMTRPNAIQFGATSGASIHARTWRPLP